jgi:HAD superfamily hydrolase (TIGR01549 family)
MLKAIIFDFDGVICESVEAKTEAFRKLFLDYPAKLKEIISYHMTQGGVSRYLKFEHIYKNILKKDLTKEKSQELGRLFTEYAYTEVVDAPLVVGAKEFLQKYGKKLKLFVASGTPEEEMVAIAKEKKLDKFFTAIYGSPKTKWDITKMILTEHHLKPTQVVFVGDAITDYQGAERNGVKFIGRLHKAYPDPFKGIKIEGYVNDLVDLEKMLLSKGLL